MFDPKFLVTLATILFIGGMNWQLQKSTADEMRREIDGLKTLPSMIQTMREDAIRQENKVARIETVEARQKAIAEQLDENSRSHSAIRNQISDLVMQIGQLKIGSSDRMTGSDFERWELELSRNNPELDIPTIKK